MRAHDIWREALYSIASHRLRTCLASLGVLTGVASVVAAMAIAEGAERRAVEEIGALGIDNVIALSREDGRAPAAPELTLEDAEALRRRFRRAGVACLRSTAGTVTGPSGGVVAATIAGVTPSWHDTGRLTLAAGRWLRRDESHAVAVLGDAIARHLFPGGDALGREVLAADEWRTVVGVLHGAGTSAANAPAQALDVDRAVFVPFNRLDLALGPGDDGTAANQIVVRVPADAGSARAADDIRRLLADAHDSSTFDVIVPRELLRTRLRAQRTFDAVLFAIGALALIAGGVGIANIMVASVTERASEIGLRRAVGARRGVVLRQFAAEAVIMSTAGGVAGVAAGTAAAAIVAAIAAWPIAITPSSVGLSLALAACVGLTAGLYPARLAASLTPMDALRQ